MSHNMEKNHMPLYWVGDCEQDLTLLLSKVDGSPVYAAIDYPLGARALNADFLPTFILELPDKVIQDKACEIRLFWEEHCLIALRRNEGWSFCMVSERKELLDFLSPKNIQSALVKKTEQTVYSIDDWARFIPKPKNIKNKFKVIKYSSDKQVEMAWRIW